MKLSYEIWQNKLLTGKVFKKPPLLPSLFIYYLLIDNISNIYISLVCYKSDITQFFLLFWVIYIIQKPRNCCVGKMKLATLHALNWYDQIYFSFFSNCEEIKLLKAPPVKKMHFELAMSLLVANKRFIHLFSLFSLQSLMSKGIYFFYVRLPY